MFEIGVSTRSNMATHKKKLRTGKIKTDEDKEEAIQKKVDRFLEKQENLDNQEIQ